MIYWYYYTLYKDKETFEKDEGDDNSAVHRNFKLVRVGVGDRLVSEHHRQNGTLLKEIILFDKKRTAVLGIYKSNDIILLSSFLTLDLFQDYNNNHTKLFDLGLLKNGAEINRFRLVYFLSMCYYFLHVNYLSFVY